LGSLLFAGLRELQAKHPCIGDVRGSGLFVGVDLVNNQDTREPATEVASYVKNRMREARILMGSEGPADNVLKIRPPLTIDKQDISYLLHTLDQVLNEVKCATNSPLCRDLGGG
jgi:4-aminobutyrate aminotransferase-like enzyme